MFRFGDPYYFLLAIPVALGAWFAYRRRVRTGIAFSAMARIDSGKRSWRVRAAGVLPALVLAGLLLLVVALAQPQIVFSRVRRTSDAIAIQMVVDISGSMEALDLSVRTPTGTHYRSRLDVVKDTFSEFVQQRPDDLIGLITFGGFTSTRAPLTLDHNALLHVLGGVETPSQAAASDGRVVNQEELLTAIGDALATACARLAKAEPESKIIILLSDGESNTGIIRPQESARLAKTMGIQVYTIGVGSTGLAPFRDKDVSGLEVIRNVHVTLDEQLLRGIAQTTGGRYFNVRDPKGLGDALEHIGTLETTTVEHSIFTRHNEMFMWFLTPGLCLIVLGAGLNMYTSRRLV